MILEFNLAYRGFALTEKQLDYWFQYFKNVKDDVFLRAIRKHIAEEPYEPRIASLLKLIRQIEKTKENNKDLEEKKAYIEKKMKKRKERLDE